MYTLVVPCTAEESRSILLLKCLVSDQSSYDYSEVKQSEADLIESGEINQKSSFISAKAGENPEVEEAPDYTDEDDEIQVADPLEPINRVFFYFNDKLYFWVLKPVASGYSAVIPEDIRIVVRNIFNNITTPVRFVNNLLQLKIKSAGIELLRFGTNTIAGVGGIADVAKSGFGLESQDEDFGQTLGVWGLGPGFYINWPIIGPSSLRDTIGLTGDYFLDPVNYVNPAIDRFAIKTGDRVNRTSLVLGEYEDIKEAAIDPYIAFRDIYYQYRTKKIKE